MTDPHGIVGFWHGANAPDPPDPREQLGRLVRAVWVATVLELITNPKPSWVTGWDELDDFQREVDMRIGAAVASAVRERLGDFIRLSDRERARTLLTEARELIGSARTKWETQADGQWMGRAMTWLDKYDGIIPGHRPRLLGDTPPRAPVQTLDDTMAADAEQRYDGRGRPVIDDD